ncbi:unnamed protein product, partial [Prorocentrum cordatum]
MEQHVGRALEAACRAATRLEPRTPHQLPPASHPCFSGCYDWHSAVHTHWLLARCLRTRPGLPACARAAEILGEHLSARNVAVEVQGLARPGGVMASPTLAGVAGEAQTPILARLGGVVGRRRPHSEPPGWEAPYGHAWLLALAGELAEGAAAGGAWSAACAAGLQALRPLERAVRERFHGWVRGLEAPNRGGVHGNTAFALLLGIRYARSCPERGDAAGFLLRACREAVARFFGAGALPPPDPGPGVPFLDAELTEALVVAEALGDGAAVPAWLDGGTVERFTSRAPADGDPHDVKTCHLIGRNFATAEALAELAARLAAGAAAPGGAGSPAAEAEAAGLLSAARRHFAAGAPHLDCGGWMGDHWVGTFALLAAEALGRAEAALAALARAPAGPPEKRPRPGPAAAGAPPRRRLLLHGGRVVQVEADGRTLRPRAWLLAEDGVVSRAGDEPPPRELLEGSELVDLRGRVAVPGLFDAHVHVFSLGKEGRVVDLSGCTSMEQLQERVRQGASDPRFARALGPYLRCGHWDQDELGRMPTRADLDAACPDLPVVADRRCFHVSVVNTRALEELGLGPDTPDPAGGTIDREGGGVGRGQPTGVLREGALELLKPLTGQQLPLADKKQLLLDGLRCCMERGATAVQTNDSQEIGDIAGSWDAYAELADEGRLPCRVFLTVGHAEIGTGSAPPVPLVHESGLLSCDRAKIWTDGAMGARTAAMLEPYADDPGNTGNLSMSPDEISAAVAKAKRHGFRLEAHAIGDRAAQEVLKGFAEHLQPADRPVMTHCQVLNADLVGRMAQQGVVANVQPQFVPSDAYGVASRLGAGTERLRHSYAWRTLRERGVRLAGGSDAPVEAPDPIAGIRCAMTHESDPEVPCSTPLAAAQRLDLGDALGMYTAGAAFAARAERFLGSLREGEEADFVVLPAAVGWPPPPEDLVGVAPDEVWVRGRCARRRAPAAGPLPPAPGAAAAAAAARAGVR